MKHLNPLAGAVGIALGVYLRSLADGPLRWAAILFCVGGALLLIGAAIRAFIGR